eukprot:395631_1
MKNREIKNDDKKYSTDVINELVNLKYGTKTECIKASQNTINYWDINEVAENLNGAVDNTITTNTSISKSEKMHIDIENCDHDNFNVFIDGLLHENGYNRQDINNILETLNDINGKKFIDLKRTQFVKILKTNGIKGAIASKVYKLIIQNKDNIYLPTHVNNNYNNSTEINSSIDYSNNTTPTANNEQNKQIDNNNDVEININNNNNNNNKQYDKDIVDQLVTLGYGSPVEIIEASDAVVNFKDVNEIVERLSNSSNSVISYTPEIIIETINVSDCAEKEFIIYVRNLCIGNGFNETDIVSVINALENSHLNGKQFITHKRVAFCRKLKEYNVKASLGSKVYKLIMDNLENIAEFLENDNEDDNDIKHEDLNVNIGLSAVEISEIAVNDFQTSA